MPRKALLTVALGAVCAVSLTACGSDDEGAIPQASADSMLAALDRAELAKGSGNCEEVQQTASAVADEASAGLPPEVPADVRDAIIDGAEQLFELANDPSACGASEEENTTTEKSTTSTESSTTTTETTDTTTTTAPPTVPTQPPEEGGGDLGQGDSGGTPPDTGSGGTGGG